jgi:hypothetical protein
LTAIDPFVGEVLRQVRRRAHDQFPRLVHRGVLQHFADAVDMAGHHVSAQLVAELQRRLDVDVARPVEPCGASEALGRHVNGKHASIDAGRRHARAV